MDRNTLADIVYLVRDLDGYEGVYETAAGPGVIIADDRSRARAAARLTSLAAMRIDIVLDASSLKNPRGVNVSASELAEAGRRHEERRTRFAEKTIETETNMGPRWSMRSILVVSPEARAHCELLRETAGLALTTHGTSSVEGAIEWLEVSSLPNIVLIDRDLPGASELERRLRAMPRFAWIHGVQWLPAQAFGVEDAQTVLDTLGVPPRRSVQYAMSLVRILVVDVRESSLADEVERAVPTARLSRATGWEALERLEEGGVDLVIAGEVVDVSLPTLVRYVSRCAHPPLLAIAGYPLQGAEMRARYPQLRRYFIDRPVCTDDLVRVLRR